MKSTTRYLCQAFFALVFTTCTSGFGQDLLIDFSRPTTPVEAGYQGYIAEHEVVATFSAQSFPAFGSTVTITPTFGATPVENPQLIDRNDQGDFLRDWIGIDNRNKAGDPITFTISGVPTGLFIWTSTHHDPNNQGEPIEMIFTDSLGTTTNEVDQSVADEPVMTTTTQLISDGSDIIVVMACLPNTDFSVMNGFELIEADSDNDGLLDSWEIEHFGHLGEDGNGDLFLDNDGVKNSDEQAHGSDPNSGDTDFDTLGDLEEITLGLDGYITDPTKPDTDDDGWTDPQEFDGSLNLFALGESTDPTKKDTDDDGIEDPDEVDALNGFVTNPNSADTDGDGYEDGYETDNVDAGWNPEDDDSAEDFDSDDLDNAGELAAGSDPLDPDTDDDGRTDGEEINGPVTSDPLVVDTDGDLIGDGDEVDNGSSPTDPLEIPGVAHLQIDFSLYPDGPLELFYQPWLALHEVNSLDSDPVGGDANGVDRLNQSFAAFGGTVDVSISYPDLDRVANPDEATLATVKQLIHRTDAEMSNYLGDKGALMQGWIGIDARATSGGNGVDTITTMRMQLDGVPAGTYRLRTYHHDVENQNGFFGIRVTDSDSSADQLSDRFRMTSSGTDNTDDPGAGNGPELLRSTVEQVIRSNGMDPIVVDFEKPGDPAVRLTFFGMNGLELEETVDSDMDDIVDSVEIALWGDLTTSDGMTDNDGDGLADLDELLRSLAPDNADTDGDGASDLIESDTGAPGPIDVNLTGAMVNASTKDVTLAWTPSLAVDLTAGAELDSFTETVAMGVTPPSTVTLPMSLENEPVVFFQVKDSPLAAGTSPFNGDSDNDGVSDGDEVNTYGSNPLAADTDGNGFDDGQEVEAGSDPTDPLDVPDRDGDGYNNKRETDAGSDPDDPASVPTPDSATSLYVDFNSNQDEGGDSSTDPDPSLSTANHNQAGYKSYHANHEVAAEFTTAIYDAFGTFVSMTPSFPNTTDERVMQSLDRTNQDAAGVVLGSFDANWNGDLINLLTDFIGADTRTGNGGNGDYDGITGTPTNLDLTFASLPAGSYDWRSYHHDTEYAWGDFQVQISTDGGGTFGPVMGPFTMTSSTQGGNPASPTNNTGYPSNGTSDPAALPSTFETTFTADGINNVVMRFTPLSETNVHRRFWGMNGFELNKN